MGQPQAATPQGALSHATRAATGRYAPSAARSGVCDHDHRQGCIHIGTSFLSRSETLEASLTRLGPFLPLTLTLTRTATLIFKHNHTNLQTIYPDPSPSMVDTSNQAWWTPQTKHGGHLIPSPSVTRHAQCLNCAAPVSAAKALSPGSGGRFHLYAGPGSAQGPHCPLSVSLRHCARRRAQLCFLTILRISTTVLNRLAHHLYSTPRILYPRIHPGKHIDP